LSIDFWVVSSFLQYLKDSSNTSSPTFATTTPISDYISVTLLCTSWKLSCKICPSMTGLSFPHDFQVHTCNLILEDIIF
jgi:hypothetical protein